MVIQEGGNQIKPWRNQTSWQSNAGYSRERNQKAIVSQAGVGQSTVSTAGWRRNVLSLLRHYHPVLAGSLQNQIGVAQF